MRTDEACGSAARYPRPPGLVGDFPDRDGGGMAGRSKARTQESDLLREYVRLLIRTPAPEAKSPSPGHDLRTCGSCGAQSRFSLDPEGVWFQCGRCGAFA